MVGAGHGGRKVAAALPEEKYAGSRPQIPFWGEKVAIGAGRPHIDRMAKWQKSITRQPPKTKDELRQMLTDAVRNTAVSELRPKLLVKGDGIADAPAACVD